MKHVTHPGFQINHQYLYQWRSESENEHFAPIELIDYNDCLYRNLYNYEYLAIIDIDEIIVPVNAYNWSELIEEIKVYFKAKSTSYEL